jgi:hypothetical protein
VFVFVFVSCCILVLIWILQLGAASTAHYIHVSMIVNLEILIINRILAKDIIASPITIADEIRPQGNLISSLNVVQIRSRESPAGAGPLRN